MRYLPTNARSCVGAIEIALRKTSAPACRCIRIDIILNAMQLEVAVAQNGECGTRIAIAWLSH